MANQITIPQVRTTGLHWGFQSGYQRFSLSYFEKNVINNDNIIDKSIINSVKYEPEPAYNNTDGHFGTCWVAEMIDSIETVGYTYYRFRNFEDLVEFYREKGYKFVNLNK